MLDLNGKKLNEEKVVFKQSILLSKETSKPLKKKYIVEIAQKSLQHA